MKKNLLLFALLISSFFTVKAQSPRWQWGVRGGTDVSYNPSYPPDEDIDDITVDKWGNVYICAQTKNYDIYIGSYGFLAYGTWQYASQTMLASFRCDGTFRWAKMIESDNGGKVFAIKTDTLGGVYCTGYIGGTSDIRNATTIDTTVSTGAYPLLREWFLLKLDTGGAYKWYVCPEDTNTIFGEQACAFDMDVDEQGNCYLFSLLPPSSYFGGAFVATHTSGWGYHYNLQYYLVKVDRNGHFINAVQLPFSAHRTDNPRQWYIRDKKRHKNIVCGICGYTAGDSLWIDGHFTGTMNVAEFDDLGNLIWLKLQDTGVAQHGLIGTCSNRCAIDRNGNIYLTAQCMSGYSFNGSVANSTTFIMKMDTNGNNLWMQHDNHVNTDQVVGVQSAVSGDTVAVFGSIMTPMMIWGTDTVTRPWNCGYRTFLTRLKASNGAVIAVDTIGSIVCGGNVNPSAGGGMIDGGSGCIIGDQYGNFYMGGTFDNVAWFGPDTLYSASGDFNFYIAKFGTTNCNVPITLETSPQPSPSEREMLRVYPNPTTDELIIEHASLAATIKLFNMVGQQVYNATVSSDKEVISTGNLVPGAYILQVTGTDGYRTIRTVVKE